MIIIAYKKGEICLKTMVFLLERPEHNTHAPNEGEGRQTARYGKRN